jgi:hypothetical protein
LPSVQEWHSAKNALPSVSRGALGKVFFRKTLSPVFAECLSVGTRQRRLYRVPDPRHLAKHIFKFLKNLCRVPNRGHLAKTITLVTDARSGHFISYACSTSLHRRRACPGPARPTPPPALAPPRSPPLNVLAPPRLLCSHRCSHRLPRHAAHSRSPTRRCRSVPHFGYHTATDKGKDSKCRFINYFSFDYNVVMIV